MTIRTLTGKTRIAGVFGWPVTHSRSPRLHGYWLDRYRIDGAYIPFSTHPSKFEQAVRALPVLGFRGANVTLPHKEKALTCVDQLTDRARRIGAVNTLMVRDDGALLGDNTDGFGFMAHLASEAPSWKAKHGPACVIGAGGAARAIVVALLETGVSEVRVINRTTRRAEEIAEAVGGPVKVLGWDERTSGLREASVLVNATTLGMAGQPALELDLHHLPTGAVVYDIVYVPLETELLKQARARGNVCVDGLGMLLHQARPGFEAWFGVEPEVTPELRQFILSDL